MDHGIRSWRVGGRPRLTPLFMALSILVALQAVDAAAQTRCPNPDTINCHYDVRYNDFILNGSVSPPSSASSPGTETSRPAQPSRDDVQRMREKEAAYRRLVLLKERIRASPYGRCKPIEESSLPIYLPGWTPKPPDDVEMEMHEADRACVHRLPFAGSKTACQTASLLLRLPVAVNPRADLERAFLFETLSCFVDTKNCTSSYDPATSDCPADSARNMTLPAAAAGPAGTCHLTRYAIDGLTPDAQRSLLEDSVAKCSSGSFLGSSCLKAAIANSTFAIPEAHPNQAYWYLAKACLADREPIDSACEELATSCELE